MYQVNEKELICKSIFIVFFRILFIKLIIQQMIYPPVVIQQLLSSVFPLISRLQSENQQLRTTVLSLLKQQEEAKKNAKELKKIIEVMQLRDKEILSLCSVPRKKVNLDLTNPQMNQLKIDHKMMIIESYQNKWIALSSEKELERNSKFMISLKTSYLAETAQTIIGVITEELRTYDKGYSWDKKGSVLMNNHCEQTLIYELGSYKNPGITIPPNSTITMVVDGPGNKVSWFLDRMVKMGERNLPEGKIYASFQFYGCSMSQIC